MELARRARERWPIIKVVLLHRVGRVGLAEPSVVIAVSTPHRGEAFEACRWLIDTLKAALGVSDEPAKKRDVSDLVGTLSAEDARAIEEVREIFDEVEEDAWR